MKRGRGGGVHITRTCYPDATNTSAYFDIEFQTALNQLNDCLLEQNDPVIGHVHV